MTQATPKPSSKSFNLEEFVAIIPNLEFNEPAPFKNQQSASRITMKTGTTNFIKVQLCREQDALYCPFGCTRKPDRMEGKVPIFDDTKPPSYSTTVAIPPTSSQFSMFEQLEEKFKEQAKQSPAWFAKLAPAKRKNIEATMTPLLKEPTPAANGEIKYPEHTLRINTKPESIQVYIMRADRKLVKVTRDPHLSITAKSRVIPIINLGYIYVTNMGWGLTCFLDSIIVMPGDQTRSIGLDAFSGLSDDMQIDETAVAEPVQQAAPTLQQMAGQQAVAEPSLGQRPTMEQPFDLDDVLME